jgi:hypothetical protein
MTTKSIHEHGPTISKHALKAKDNPGVRGVQKNWFIRTGLKKLVYVLKKSKPFYIKIELVPFH